MYPRPARADAHALVREWQLHDESTWASSPTPYVRAAEQFAARASRSPRTTPSRKAFGIIRRTCASASCKDSRSRKAAMPSARSSRWKRWRLKADSRPTSSRRRWLHWRASTRNRRFAAAATRRRAPPCARAMRTCARTTCPAGTTAASTRRRSTFGSAKPSRRERSRALSGRGPSRRSKVDPPARSIGQRQRSQSRRSFSVTRNGRFAGMNARSNTATSPATSPARDATRA